MAEDKTNVVICPVCGQKAEYRERGDHSLPKTKPKCKRNLDPLACRFLREQFSETHRVLEGHLE